ncbi:MAG: BspA family leucine-rich repeat surface protein [Agathobacter sp.]|nr:BspA family leucine-rich repeat surface protein [Agathobacter sp.]
MGKRLLSAIISLGLVVSMLPVGIRGEEAVSDPSPVTFEYEDEHFKVELDDGCLDVLINGDWQGDVPWSDYRNQITEVTLRGSGMTKLTALFKDYTKLERVTVGEFDASTVTDCSEMFYNCQALKKVDIRNLNLAAAEKLDKMFDNCYELTSINVNGWSFGNKQVSARSLFRNCRTLKSLDLSSWKGTKVICNLDSTFRDCEQLEKLTLTGLDLSGVSSWANTFRNDAKLSTKFTVSGTAVDTGFCLLDAATAEGSKITVRYVEDAYAALAKRITESAHEESNIVLWKIPKITSEDVKLSSTKMAYDGKEQKPEVTVTVNKVKLVEGTDYTLSYSNNIKPTDSAIVKVTGMEDYRGSVEKEFSVAKEANKITVPSESYHKVTSTKSISFTFSAKCKEGSLACKSDNSKIKASISKKGIVTVKIAAKYLGTANISLTSKSTEKLAGETIKVKVTAGPKGTTISSAKSSVAGQAVITWKKNSAVSGYQLRYSEASDMAKSSTKTVSKAGTVKKNLTGLKDSKTYYVQIRTYRISGKKKIYSAWSSAKTVTVAQIAISDTKATIYKGDTRTIRLVGTKQKAKWTSSNKSVATVDKNGKVKAIKAGTATITATLGKKKFTCKVTVKNKSGYKQLYDYIILNGKSNKEGNLVIRDGNYGIIYNFKNKTFDFIYVKDGEEKKDSMTFSIGEKGSKTASAVYAYSDGLNFCRAEATFTVAKYKKGANLSFKPSVYRGYETSTFIKMANTTFVNSMKAWSGLVKKAGTSMKAIGFKTYK